MGKASILVGYTKSDLGHYRNWDSKGIAGGDIEAKDGLGNIIKVSVREGGIGYRISLNGKDIASSEMSKREGGS